MTVLVCGRFGLWPFWIFNVAVLDGIRWEKGGAGDDWAGRMDSIVIFLYKTLTHLSGFGFILCRKKRLLK